MQCNEQLGNSFTTLFPLLTWLQMTVGMKGILQGVNER